MAEVLTLSVPQNIVSYSVNSIRFEWGQQLISIEVLDNTGKSTVVNYAGDTAKNLMISLNKANLSVTSLQKRILNQLAADGKLPAGNITGTPD